MVRHVCRHGQHCRVVWRNFFICPCIMVAVFLRGEGGGGVMTRCASLQCDCALYCIVLVTDPRYSRGHKENDVGRDNPLSRQQAPYKNIKRNGIARYHITWNRRRLLWRPHLVGVNKPSQQPGRRMHFYANAEPRLQLCDGRSYSFRCVEKRENILKIAIYRQTKMLFFFLGRAFLDPATNSVPQPPSSLVVPLYRIIHGAAIPYHLRCCCTVLFAILLYRTIRGTAIPYYAVLLYRIIRVTTIPYHSRYCYTVSFAVEPYRSRYCTAITIFGAILRRVSCLLINLRRAAMGSGIALAAHVALSERARRQVLL